VRLFFTGNFCFSPAIFVFHRQFLFFTGNKKSGRAMLGDPEHPNGELGPF
jgi:hypothetical protein